ncbi:MAG TPA: pyridoxamine 5'-phosphate oxidase family protein [Candidatus Lustribacter sp.]|jgi:predicted pyridoxine 5'-phosphate oxidase superfamily flavin-nucleotide-binding protein|nr:pyridoxamine 5'-phosphate oxidase family protein [Candidatus Lustribacter sp.]
MIQMTDDMRRWLEQAPDDGVPCLVGTSTKDGRPQISPKGSVAVFDPETLCFWERGFRSTYDAIAENAHVVVYLRNPQRTEIPYRGHCVRFHGEARIATDAAERDRAWALTNALEQSRDPERKGVAVLIRVDLIEDLGGVAVMKRD